MQIRVSPFRRRQLSPEGPAETGGKAVVVFYSRFRRRLAVVTVLEGQGDEEVLDKLKAELRLILQTAATSCRKVG